MLNDYYPDIVVSATRQKTFSCFTCFFFFNFI